jgi:hypothetical protein
VSAGYTTLSASEAAEVIAPDGSSVLPLCVLPGAASFACFELKPWQVSQAVSHATAEEIWYIISGSGKYGAVHTGEFFGIAPTGRETKVRIHDFHEIVDGRIVRAYHMEDWLSWFQQVGSWPSN